MPKLIVCLTGMPGAGKSTIADGLQARGYEVANMGNAVRAEARRRNQEPTGENLGSLMLELRERDGPGAVAMLIAPQIRKAGTDTVIVDGIRSNAEIEVLRRLGNVRILSVHASTDTRFGFLTKRRRADDPKTRAGFQNRDDRELGVGISTSIALADETVSNNNMSVDGLVEMVHGIILRWVRRDEDARV